MEKFTANFSIAVVLPLIFSSIGVRPDVFQQSALRVVGVEKRAEALAEICPALQDGEGGNRKMMQIIRAAGESASRYQLDPELILAVIANESRCRPEARSNRGAMGLMQLMPRTANWLGVNNPYQIHDNVEGGAKYLSYLLDNYDGNLHSALAAYNAGPKRISERSTFWERLSRAQYVAKIIATYRDFRKLRETENPQA